MAEVINMLTLTGLKSQNVCFRRNIVASTGPVSNVMRFDESFYSY